MTLVPQFILRRMYVGGSLRLTAEGVAFDLKNALGPGHLIQFSAIRLGEKTYEASQIRLTVGSRTLWASEISEAAPLAILAGVVATCELPGETLAPAHYEIQVSAVVREAGSVTLKVEDELRAV